MQLVRRLEDHITRARMPRDPVLQHLERAAPHDHQLLVRMAMRCVRRLAWRERRYVHLQA